MSDNPVLVEILRGLAVESRHRGAFAVIDANGSIVSSLGDIERPIFPRSAVKALQALPLIESGAADRYQLDDRELALTISSHSGEPGHVETARSILAKVGRNETCLECGAHWPMSREAERALAASGQQPSTLHNNCSGKHAGFVCLACGMDEDPKDYILPQHIVQREIRAAGEAMTEFKVQDEWTGIDGCSIPTYAVPLRHLGLAFAKIGTGKGLSPKRAEAAQRLRKAAAAHPFMVAGTGRFDTEAMLALGPKLFMKTGAEGVYCAALPDQGLGIAIKIDDGEVRAAQAVLAGLVHRLLPMTDLERKKLDRVALPILQNWNRIQVGQIRVVAPLA